MADPAPTRIGIFGAGAMGSLYGGLLADAGVETWLVGRSSEHAAVVETQGLRLTYEGAERLTRPRATTHPAAAGEVDLLMIWVKSQHTDAALEAAAPMIGQHTLVASFQNGLGNVEKIAALVGRSRVVYGVSTIGGVTRDVGRVEMTAATWHGNGTTWMGVLEGEPDHRLEPLRALFEKAGIRTEVRPDVDTFVWSKLSMAVPMNSLAALTRLSMGGVIDDPGLADLQRRMTTEIVEVAQARGIPLDLGVTLRLCEETYAAARGHLPSMLQDVLRGRSTEVDSMAGAVVREAERLGVKAPVMSIVWRLAAAVDQPEPDRTTTGPS
ncbi:MAG: ketopantoate reductase family protein [Solirubrobacteraceae bacterium]